jgi:hypothetical protein
MAPELSIYKTDIFSPYSVKPSQIIEVVRVDCDTILVQCCIDGQINFLVIRDKKKPLKLSPLE